MVPESSEIINFLKASKEILVAAGGLVLFFVALLTNIIPNYLNKSHGNAGAQSLLIKYYAFFITTLKFNIFGYRQHKYFAKDQYRFTCFLSNGSNDFEGRYEIPHLRRMFGGEPSKKADASPINKDLTIIKQHIDSLNQIAIIRAPAGFGKTNLSRYLATQFPYSKIFLLKATELLEEAVNTGIFDNRSEASVSAKDRCLLHRQSYQLPFLIDTILAKHEYSLSVGYIKRKLKMGAIILVDEFDVINSLNDKERIIKLLSDVNNSRAFNLKIVVFGRDLSFSSLTNTGNTIYYSLLSLSSEQIKSITEKTVRSNFPDISFNFDDFHKRISLGSVRDMSSNPLFLTMMISLYVGRGETLPENKSKLVGEVVREMVKRRFDNFPCRKISYDEYIEVIPHLMNDNSVKGSNPKFRSSEKLAQWMKEKGVEKQDLLSALVVCGLLIKNSLGTYESTHKTIHEYFQSELLLKNCDDFDTREILDILMENLASEIAYYFFYKVESIDGFFLFLLNNSYGDPAKDFRLCTYIYTMKQLIPELKLSPHSIDLYVRRLDHLKEINVQLYAESLLSIILEKIKFGFPIMSDPFDVSIIQAINRKQKVQYITKGTSLIFESEEKISMVLFQLNKSYSDNRGSFELLNRLDVVDSLRVSDDEIIAAGVGYTFYDTKSHRFVVIKKKYEGYVKKKYDEIISKTELSSANISHELLVRVRDALIRSWQPDLLINNFTKTSIEKLTADEIYPRKPVRLKTIAGKDALIRDGQLSNFKEKLEAAYNISVDSLNLRISEAIFKEKLNEKRLAEYIIACSYGLVVELFYNYENSSLDNMFLLSKLTTLSALEEGVLAPWGRLRVKFGRSHD